MSEVQIRDTEGNTITVLDFNGYLMYPFPNVKERLEILPNLEIRDDDVLICSYPKTGSHWLRPMTAMLLHGKAEYLDQKDSFSMLELFDASTLDMQQSPRVLNTHLFSQWIPRGIMTKRCKMVFLFRNPKDVAVSYYCHLSTFGFHDLYEGGWNNFFELFLDGRVPYGSWIDFTIHYEEFLRENPDLPFYFIMYEDLKKDPVATLKRFAQFLKIEVDDKLCTDILDKCSLKNLREKDPLKTVIGVNIKSADTTVYRKGKVGDWKNWFTVSQNERFDEVYQKHMKEFKLRFKFEI